jgi:hypothetical protein
MTTRTRRIVAAALIALGLAAGGSAVAATGTGHAVASAPQTFYRG